MNIKKIRQNIEQLKNKKIHLKVNGARNQIEEFECVITEVYNYIFIVDTSSIKRSFSYTDILIGNIEIKP